MQSRRAFGSLVLASLVLAGCGDSLAPGALPGTYALQRVAGAPLPAVVATNDYGAILVYSEAIRLELGGTGRVSTVSEIIPHDPVLPREGSAPFESEIRWASRNGRIRIEYVCGPLEHCAPGPHLVGIHSGHDLRLKWGPHVSGRAPLEYLEVPSPQ